MLRPPSPCHSKRAKLIQIRHYAPLDQKNQSNGTFIKLSLKVTILIETIDNKKSIVLNLCVSLVKVKRVKKKN